MIINIPLQIDETEIERVAQQDYMNRVTGEIVRCVKSALESKATSYYGNRESSGMIAVIEMVVDEYFKKYEKDIIEVAGEKLADKLARSKKGKELIEQLSQENKQIKIPVVIPEQRE